MKVLILGATGRTGRHVLEQALELSWEVSILVRDTKKVVSKSSKLNIFEGSPIYKKDIQKAIKGCEVVIVVLNVSRKSDFPWASLVSPKNLISKSVENTLFCMQNNDIKRIVSISAAGVGNSVKEIPFWFRWLIQISNIKYAYQDHQKQEEILQENNIDWTVIRPVGLTNSKKFKPLIISFENKPKPKLLISRRHVAKFILDCITNNSYIKEIPTISEK